MDWVFIKPEKGHKAISFKTDMLFEPLSPSNEDYHPSSSFAGVSVCFSKGNTGRTIVAFDFLLGP